MNDTTKRDLRVQKTRSAIKNAFKEMVCEMDANQITVKELAERAQIHRKTFYLHYSSIEALFEDMISELANHYYNKIDQLTPPYSHYEVNKVFFEFCCSLDLYGERLLCAPSYRDFCNRLFAETLHHNRQRYNPYAALSEHTQNLINHFLPTSSLDLYHYWIETGKKISPEELIHISGELLTHGISAFIPDTE